MAHKRTTFEGREVIGSEVKLTGAAADADGVDPHYVGDIVFVVCEAAIDRIEHQAVKDSDKLTRIATARSIVGAVVDADLVREAIELARMSAESKKAATSRLRRPRHAVTDLAVARPSDLVGLTERATELLRLAADAAKRTSCAPRLGAGRSHSHDGSG